MADILNAENYTIVSGTSDNDSIENTGSDVTVIGSAGNDYIFNNGGTNVSFKYSAGDGNDSVYGFNSTSSLSIAGGEYSSALNDNDTIITVGEGSILLIGNSDDTAYAGDEPSEGDDNIENRTANVTIKALGGNDFIENSSSNVLLAGGAGNDTIFNKTTYTEYLDHQIAETVTAQEEEPIYEDVQEYGIIGAHLERIPYQKWLEPTLGWITDYKLKTVYDYGYYTVKKQTGTQSVDKVYTVISYAPEAVERQAENVGATILGGAGDDYIVNEASDFVYEYALGDGNDTVEGFNASSKLSISGGDYTASASGNDVILKVGNGSITLTETKGKVLNINDEEVFKTDWTLDGTTAIYGTELETLATVKGIKSLDGLSLKKKVITVSASALNKKSVTVSGGYEFDFASNYKNATITGGKSDDTITARGKNLSINGAGGNDKLYGGAGKDTLTGGKGDDSLWGNAGADTFIYAKGDGNDVIFGFDDNDTLTIDNLKFTSSYSSKDKSVALAFDNGSITLKNFTATTFHVNDDIYKISKKKFVKQ